MKIGVLTFHNAINYGAILQTYATQRYFERLGHEINIIDYRNKSIDDAYLSFTFSVKRMFYRKPWNIPRYLITTYYHSRKKKKQIDFSNEYLNLTQYPMTEKEIKDYDLMLIGSDQVWNPNFTGGLDPIYWGQIPHYDAKVVAWAASSKEKALKDDDKKDIASLLKNFTAISVRETKLQSFISPLCSIPVHVILDPTLLLAAEDWRRLCHPVVESSYVLVYAMEDEGLAIRAAERLAAKHGKKVVVINPYSNAKIQKGYKTMLSPTDFLSYIMYADHVITASFHGTAFSIIFQKDFYCFVKSTKSNVRIESLLQQLGLGDRIINEGSSFTEINRIEYIKVESILQQLREDASRFVKSFM